MHLSPEEVAGRQAEMDRLKRIWRKVVAEQQRLSPAQRQAQRAAMEQRGIVGMSQYRAQLVAAKTEECAAPVDVSARLKDAGIEPQHLEGLRQGLQERAAFTAARRWWSQAKVACGEVEAVDEATGNVVLRPRLVRQHPFLVLCGASGLGKSQAAAWCMRSAVRAYPWNTGAGGGPSRRPFVVWHGTDMAATPLYGNHSAARSDWAEDQWEEAERAVVLVLDDLFAQRKPLSGPHHDRLTRLLTSRHGRGAATVLTVNLSPPALAELLDGSGSSMQGPLYRRLLQAGHIVELRAKGAPSVLIGGRAAP